MKGGVIHCLKPEEINFYSHSQCPPRTLYRARKQSQPNLHTSLDLKSISTDHMINT